MMNPETTNNRKSIESLAYLKQYLLPYKIYIILMSIALLITSTSILSIGKMMQYVIDSGISKSDPVILNKSLFCLMLLISILAVATAVRYFFITYIGEKVINDIRIDAYNQILKLPPSFFEAHKAGEILSRLTNDTTLLQTVIGSSISVALRNIVMLVGSIIMMILTNPKLALVIFTIIPVVVFPIIILSREMRKFSRTAQDKIASLIAMNEETISALKTIQAYTQEEYEVGVFKQKAREVIQAAVSRIRFRAFLSALVIFLVFSAISMILWIGGHDILAARISPGELSSFIFLAILSAGAVGALSDVFGDLQKAAGATERLVEFLSISPKIADKENAKLVPEDKENLIEFKDVSFSYSSQGSEFCLDKINFTIKRNRAIAIVGASGSGKSTIFQLLLRFYDIQSGQILLNGLDIRDIMLNSLRNKFSYVSQDSVIFSATAYENIGYSKLTASKQEIEQAAKDASAFEFISKMSSGFSTFLGEKGGRLSGGEKQRVAIARALLKQADIILLDEVTSALDSANEARVQSTISNLLTSQDKTVITVTHKLASIKNSDHIIVMKHGKVVEQGTHDELVSKEGEYLRLLNVQVETNS